MRRPHHRTSRAARRLTVIALAWLCWADADPARADSLSDELGFGVIVGPGLRAWFSSEQLAAELWLGDAWQLSASASVDHYLSTRWVDSSNVLSFSGRAEFHPTRQWWLGLELSGSPVHTRLEHGAPSDPEVFTTDISALAAELEASYKARISQAFSGRIKLTLAGRRYAARERWLATVDGPVESEQSAALWQVHSALTLTGVFRKNSELALSGAWYGYLAEGLRPDTSTLLVADGMPLEPKLYTGRLALSQRIAPLELAAYGQYAGYLAARGHSWEAGLTIEVALSKYVDVALTEVVRRALYDDGYDFGVYVTSLTLTCDW